MQKILHMLILPSGLVISLGVVSLGTATAAAEPPSPIDLQWLREDCGDGALVHHADGRLYLTELSTGVSVFLAAGQQPEFSPDSSKIAWIDGTTAKGRMRRGDATIHTIASGVEPSGGVHWLSNTEVAVVLDHHRRKAWYRVSLGGDAVELPGLTRLGTGGYECDVRLGRDGIWSYVAKRSWKTSDGRDGTLPGTCSVSLSVDGRTATSLHNPHKDAPLTAIRPGGLDANLRWPYRGGFDNHRWSSNDARYIVAVDEHHQTMAVMTPDARRVTRMGNPGTGQAWHVWRLQRRQRRRRTVAGYSHPGRRQPTVAVMACHPRGTALRVGDGPRLEYDRSGLAAPVCCRSGCGSRDSVPGAATRPSPPIAAFRNGPGRRFFRSRAGDGQASLS